MGKVQAGFSGSVVGTRNRFCACNYARFEVGKVIDNVLIVFDNIATAQRKLMSHFSKNVGCRAVRLERGCQ